MPPDVANEPALPQIATGDCGEYWVAYHLTRWGWQVQIVNNMPFDLIAYRTRPDRMLRLQVKSTTGPRKGNARAGYSFCTTGQGGRYNRSDFDAYALVALDLERFVVRPWTPHTRQHVSAHAYFDTQNKPKDTLLKIEQEKYEQKDS